MPGKRLIGVILLAELVEPGVERRDVGRGPPVAEAAALVVLRALVVEMMAEFVADDRADAAIVDRRIGIGIEERRLQDRGGEDDLDHAEIGVGVDRHRGHAPFPAIDRLAELADVVGIIERVGAHRIAERVAAIDLQRRTCRATGWDSRSWA